jgi:protein-tyrosine phosphatase
MVSLVGLGGPQRHFIDLTQAGELEPYAELLTEEAGSGTSYERFPIRDVSVPDEPKTMAEIIAAIDRAIAEGGITYVHCWGGIGRTGLAVACWLQERGQTPDEALTDLADKMALVRKISADAELT